MKIKGYVVLFIFLLPLSLAGQEISMPDNRMPKEEPAEELLQNVLIKKDSLLTVGRAMQDTVGIRAQLDSLRRLSHSLDTLRIKKTLDSLQHLPAQLETVQTKADSLQGLLNISAQANSKIVELNRKLHKPLQEGRQELQEKINHTTRLQGVSAEGLADLEEQSGLDRHIQLPEIEGLSLNGLEGLPAMDIAGVDIPEGEMPDISLNGLDLGGVGEVGESLGKLSELSEEAGAYSEDVLTLSKGNLQDVKNADKLAEQQFLGSEAGGAFQEQMSASQAGMGEFRQMAGRDYLQNQGKEQAYKAAVDHFEGHAEELKAAQAELNKYKGRFQKVESMKEMPKGFFKINPLKDTPWHERMLFGSLWQFGKQEQFLIDLGPTLVWRFTDKIEAGGGYQWRVNIGKEKPWLSTKDKVYGYSLFADYKIKKGFFARLIFEDLNTGVPRFNSKREIVSKDQEWVKGLSVGLGKSYTFYKSLQGYSLVQYNVLHRHNKTPYVQPFQAKIGFYLNGKHVLKFRNKREKE